MKDWKLLELLSKCHLGVSFNFVIQINHNKTYHILLNKFVIPIFHVSFCSDFGKNLRFWRLFWVFLISMNLKLFKYLINLPKRFAEFKKKLYSKPKLIQWTSTTAPFQTMEKKFITMKNEWFVFKSTSNFKLLKNDKKY